jgi:hypothetical protein
MERKYIFLDLKDWIEIGKDFYKHEINEAYSIELDWVLESVTNGMVCFPLVHTHFLEFYKNSTPIRRSKLAKTMSLLSLGYLIADQRTRLAYEVRLALAKLFNISSIKPETMIVRGLSRAFMSDEAFANLTGIDKNRFSRILEAMDNLDSWIEYFESIDEHTRKFLMHKFREANHEQVKTQESFRKTNCANSDLLLRTYYARLFFDTQTTILQVMNEYNISKDDLFRIDGITLAAEIPSYEIEAKLTVESMKQKTRRIVENDSYDISSLAAAIPYCSVVITEAFWVDLCIRLKFDQKYNCVFLKNYKELPKTINF